MDYSAGVWGYKQFDLHDRLQHKALRTFLGVGKQTPLAAIDGDVAWDAPKLRRHVEMIRLWCRLVKMDQSRIPFKVLKYDMQTSLRVRNTWAREIKTIFEQCNMLDYYDINASALASSKFIVDTVQNKLRLFAAQTWQQNLHTSPKLRTYRTYKNQLKTEKYLFRYMSKKQRSFYVKFRCGTFPINIELGRYRNPKIPVENRLCKVCDMSAIEDEKHFLIECPGYTALRSELLTNLNITGVSDDDKFLTCMKTADCKIVANFLISAFGERNHRLSRPVLTP